MNYKKYSVCTRGKLQSPINIISKKTKRCGLRCDLMFYYRPSACRMKNLDKQVLIQYDSGSYVIFNSQVYELDQFSFTVPSSHKLDGTSYPVELNIYHRSPETNKALIISVFIDVSEASSTSMAFFNTFIPFLPRVSTTEKVINMSKDWNLYRTIPKNKAFYNYEGSLLLPPCTENVSWIVMDSAINMNTDCYTNLKMILGKNIRPIQRTYSRNIYYNPNNAAKNNKNFGSKLKCYTDEQLASRCACLMKNNLWYWSPLNALSRMGTVAKVLLVLVFLCMPLIFMFFLNAKYGFLNNFLAYLNSMMNKKMLKISK